MKGSRETRKAKGERRLIELRRAKIMELLSNGHTSQVSISETLNVSEPTVSRDIRFLKDRARKELDVHFQERLPFEYARAMAGINATLARVSDMLEKEAKDPKTKIEIMKLQMELWKSVMSMATDGGLLERIMKGIRDNGIHSESKEHKSETNIASNNEEEITEESEEEPTKE
jgi:DNA-binding Lrp family transcriptional regulator